MDTHDTKATLELIGELWPGTLRGSWAWSGEQWSTLSEKIARLPITFEQSRACLRNAYTDIGSAKKPDVRVLVTRLQNLVPPNGGPSDRPNEEPIIHPDGVPCSEWVRKVASGRLVYDDLAPEIVAACKRVVDECDRLADEQAWDEANKTLFSRACTIVMEKAEAKRRREVVDPKVVAVVETINERRERARLLAAGGV